MTGQVDDVFGSSKMIRSLIVWQLDPCLGLCSRGFKANIVVECNCSIVEACCDIQVYAKLL